MMRKILRVTAPTTALQAYKRIKKRWSLWFIIVIVALPTFWFGRTATASPLPAPMKAAFSFTSSPGIAILPDDGYIGILDGNDGFGTDAGMVCNNIDTSGTIPAGRTVKDVTVELAASHTWVGDLTFKLRSPDGSILGLMSRPGHNEPTDDGTASVYESSDLLTTHPIRFTDAETVNDAENMGGTIGAAGVICRDDGQCQFFPNPGSVAGLTNLAGFAGENASGNWTLCIGDSGPGDIGTFQSWTLGIETMDEADLSITKAASPDPVEPGSPLTYALTFSNIGVVTATNVLITDVVPITITNLSYTSSGVTITPVGNISYTWQVGDLNPSEGGTITITGVVSPGLAAGLTLINTATITTTTEENDTDNNSDTVEVTIANAAPVAVDDSASTTADTPVTISVLDNDSDLNGDVLSVVAVGTPANGIATISSPTTVVYTPTLNSNDTFTYTASDGSLTDTATVIVTVGEHGFVYLPLIFKSGAIAGPAPDLVVEQIMATSNNVQVVIKNQGDAPVQAADEFWVDFYVDPHPEPTGVNQTWDYPPGRCIGGLVWEVTAPALPLEPGEVLPLTLADGYYRPFYSYISWPLAPDTPVYAQVDSANVNTTYGAVLENHEIRNEPYNNIINSTVSGMGQAAGVEPAVKSANPPAPSGHAPPRP
jgi:uncharacterized repeat protein (TIGR01451 family)